MLWRILRWRSVALRLRRAEDWWIVDGGWLIVGVRRGSRAGVFFMGRRVAGAGEKLKRWNAEILKAVCYRGKEAPLWNIPKMADTTTHAQTYVALSQNVE